MKKHTVLGIYFYIIYILFCIVSNKSLYIVKDTQQEFTAADSSYIAYLYTIFLIFQQICINLFYF